MKKLVYLGAFGIGGAVLLAGAFAPRSLLRGTSENSESPQRAGFFSRAPAPTPTPKPVPAVQELAITKLGWLSRPVTPESLFEAAGDREYFVAGLLLDAGIDVNAMDANGRTPLLIATEAKDEKMIDLILEHRPDVNLFGDGSPAPLVVAALQDDTGVMKRLLELGANPKIAVAEGESLLWRMAANGKVEQFDTLLKAGADPSALGPDGLSPLDAALRGNHLEIAKSLFALETAPRTEWSQPMREAMAKALKSGNREIVSLLLEHHPGPPKPEGATQSLLAYSLAWDDINTFRTLLDCGADPNERLVIPAERKFIDTVGVDDLAFYLQNEEGMNVFMLASALGRLPFVQALMEKGADRSARTAKYKMVPMNFAQRMNQTRTILALMGKNPDPSTHTTRIAISLSDQRAVYYKDGVAVFRTPVSTGRKNFRTPSGEFVVTDKNRSRVSSIYEVEMPYFMRLNGSGYGMHEGYVPDYPASHGCIRLPRAAAKKLFSEVEVGTYVTISE